MKVVCAWCRKQLPDKPPYDDDRINHGMCSECYETATGMPLDIETGEGGD